MRLVREYAPSVMVLGTCALILGLGPSVVRRLSHEHERMQAQLAADRLDQEDGILAELNRAFRDIAVAVEPSVVHITAAQRVPGRTGRPSISTGSGWIYDDAGHIVTNHHVVADALDIDVQLHSGQIRSATLVGSDRSTDIAVVRIDPVETVPAQRADVEAEIQQGDLVFTFGSPFDFRFSMSAGVVSGKGRTVGVIQDGRTDGYEDFIQVDAAINPGNSGGPLADYRGRIIGMNTAIATGGGRGSVDDGQFGGIGLAIPLTMIEPVVEQLIEKGYVTKGFLGVRMVTVSGPFRSSLEWDGGGAIVQQVEPGTPADIAGLRRNDIITRFKGESIQNRQQVTARISSTAPGIEVSMEVHRRDDDDSPWYPVDLTVVLAELDTLMARGVLPPNQSEDEIASLGILAMETSTTPRTRSLGIEDVAGVIITDFDPEAFPQRMRANGIVTHVGTIRVNSTRTFLDALSQFDLRAVTAPRGGAPLRILLPDGDVLQCLVRDIRG